MIALLISMLFCSATIMAIAVLSQSLRTGLRAFTETNAVLAACKRHSDFLVRMEELQVRPALPRARTLLVGQGPVSPVLAPRRQPPQRRLLRAAA